MAAVTAAVVATAGTVYAADQSKKASRDQTRALERSQDTTNRLAAQSADEAKNLFARGKQSQNEGYQHAINLLTGTMPQQANLINQGNVNAQQTLLGGGQGFMDALLGHTTNPYSYLQASQPQEIDFSFFDNFTTQPGPVVSQADLVNQSPTPFVRNASELGGGFSNGLGGRVGSLNRNRVPNLTGSFTGNYGNRSF